MGNTSLNIALVLTAINKVSPTLQKAENDIKRFSSTINRFSGSIKNQNPFQGWSSGLDKFLDRAGTKLGNLGDKVKYFQEQTGSFQNKMQQLELEGGVQLATGLILARELSKPIDSAAELQTNLVTLKLSGTSEQGLKNLEKQAEELSQRTIFGKRQVIDVELSLSRAGLNEQKIKNSLQSSTYLAEMEYQRTKADPAGTAKRFAQMSEQLGLTSTTADERKAHGLNTQASVDSYIAEKLKKFADQVNRVATVTSASVDVLAESSKYFNLVGRIQGLKVEDMMMTQGLAARFGLEGSIGGTHLKDFFSRMNPYEFFGHGKTGMATQLAAMYELGYLKDAKYSITRAGRKKFTQIGGDVFHDEKGNLKSPTVIFGQLAKSYEKYKNIPQGIQKFEGLMKAIYGEQGRDIAAAVAQNYEAMSQLEKDMSKVPHMDAGIKEYQKTFHQQWNVLKTNVQNIGMKAGGYLLPELTETVKRLEPQLNRLMQWIEKHPQAVKNIGRFALAMAGLNITLGAGKLVVGMLSGQLAGFAGGLLRVGGWAISAGRGMIGFYQTFRYFRQGAGIFRSLWSAVSFGSPFLTKTGLLIGRLASGMGSGALMILRFGGRLIWLGAQALLMGARMAIAWLIGLGPVGWAILGVTALIAAGVAAWKTNFGGFKDWVIKWANKVVEFINKVRKVVGAKPLTIKFGDDTPDKKTPKPKPTGTVLNLTSWEDKVWLNKLPKTPAAPQPAAPFVKMPQNNQDNRKYTFNINSQRPDEVAKKVAEVTGGKDKYMKSRDPRLQNGDFAFAGGH